MIDPKLIEQVIQEIKHGGANYQYYFEHISSPEWIRPLSDNGFLLHPFEPIEESGYIQFPYWPESRFLIKVAHQAPEATIEVALRIADTRNTQVQIDLIDAIMSTPPEIGVKLAPFVEKWVDKPYLLLPQKIRAYISYLCHGEKAGPALRISRELLMIIPGHYQKEFISDTEIPSIPPEPGERIALWEYEQFLKENAPDLIGVAPQETFQLFCNLLEDALMLSKNEKTPDFVDFSQAWRPAIEPHPQNNDRDDIKNLLVSCVRDIGGKLIENNIETIAQLVEELEARKWTIFRRIALHLVDKFGKNDLKLVISKLANRQLFNSSDVYHEYFHLAQNYFGDLNQSERDVILDWIEQGPDLTFYIERTKKEKGKPPTDEDIATEKEFWQLRLLAILIEKLPAAWQQRYKELVSKYSKPEHPDLLSWTSGVQWGPRSPISVEQINGMDPNELAEFLRKWVPPKGFTMESPEGVGRMLTEAIRKTPLKFTNQLEKFYGLDPTYLRGLVSGLREAIKGNQVFDWLPVLDFCNWIVQQPREILGRSQDRMGDWDPHWGWARREVAALLEDALQEDKDHGISYKYETKVWNILKVLIDDPDPTPSYEERYGGSNMDPDTLSINTTRGVAFHTIIVFAAWCQSHNTQLVADEELESSRISEVIDILEKHLNILVEPSLAIRSVYGFRFGSLIYINREWANSIINRVFPQEEDVRNYWQAAWEGFIKFNNPTVFYWEMLKDVYQLAVNRLDRPRSEIDKSGSSDGRLAEHLMVYYWLGFIDVDSTILKTFWKNARLELREYAFDFIGRNLYNATEEIPADVIVRFKLLWDEQLNSAKTSVSKEIYANELKAFGWWFVSGSFVNEWAFENLLEVLNLFGEIEAHHLVVKRLSQLAEEYPEKAVTILNLMVEGDRKGWGIDVWRVDAKHLLKIVLASTDESAKNIAVTLINKLGAKGRLDFGELLI